jgi:hypothetical protein
MARSGSGTKQRAPRCPAACRHALQFLRRTRFADGAPRGQGAWFDRHRRRGIAAGPGLGHGMKGMRLPNSISQEEEAAMVAELANLRQEHRDLDAAIAALELIGTPDRLQLQRLKKRKLSLKDRISFLEDMLTPDIIA